MPCSWIERISIVKIPTLPKMITKFNATPIKISLEFFFTKYKKKNPKIHMKPPKPQIAKTLWRKNDTGGITFPVFIIHYNASATKAVSYCNENICIEQ